MALELKTSETVVETPMVDLFSIDGTMYQIPAKPKVNIALKYLRLARTQGPEIAAGWLLEELLGTEAYDALMGFDDLAPDDLEQLMEAVQTTAIGALETPQAPLGAGSRRRSPQKRSSSRG